MTGCWADLHTPPSAADYRLRQNTATVISNTVTKISVFSCVTKAVILVLKGAAMGTTDTGDRP